MSRPGWTVLLDPAGDKHVVPLDDLREHVPTECWCDPFTASYGYRHQAADQREEFEQGRRKPS